MKKVNLHKLFPAPPEAPVPAGMETARGVLVDYMSIRNLPFAFDLNRIVDGVEAEMQYYMPYNKFVVGATEARKTEPPMKILSIKLQERVNIYRLLQIAEAPVMREFARTGIAPHTLKQPFEFRFDTDILGYNQVQQNKSQGYPRAGL